MQSQHRCPAASPALGHELGPNGAARYGGQDPGAFHHIICRDTIVGKFLMLTQSAVNQAVRSGEKLAEEMNLT